MTHWMEGDWPEVGDDGFARLCDRCHKPVPKDWEYGWCKDCGENGTCGHGNKPHECNECMIESDIAYDASHSSPPKPNIELGEPND